MAIKEGLQYYSQGNFLRLIIEIDSLVIAWDIRHIQTMIMSHGEEVVHVLREGNSLADALTKSDCNPYLDRYRTELISRGGEYLEGLVVTLGGFFGDCHIGEAEIFFRH
ncbi:hypothetical protein R3W88_029627 [Solanum pinnatisectum]|uniref:RNase H type-1 domain-containing protein n=1 Tax=Solanum pinnatisectum TaxID=50273 RepID=A0AAV9K9D5_9SOLN|nr:hypothetical protein R3W88_029627 [Solanum pinnatisectum]